MADLYSYPGGPGSEDWKKWYYNYEPDAGYNNWMQAQGLGMGEGRAADPYRSFVSSLYSKYQGDYKGLAANNPNMEWTDYLKQQNPQQQYAGMSPGQRGENPGQFSPRMRWVV